MVDLFRKDLKNIELNVSSSGDSRQIRLCNVFVQHGVIADSRSTNMYSNY